jgi:Leucine-rich repeat (LRR) protein
MRELEAGRLIAAARQRSEAGDHDAYLHAEGLMQQAVALSSNDPTAIQALRDLRLNRTERALAAGDIALASELAVSLGHDPELEDVRQRIAEAQRRRTRRRRISIALGVALTLSLATGAYVQTGQWLDRQRQWRDVAVWPGETAAAHLTMAGGETAATKDGVIRLKARQLYTLAGDYPADDVRIELEACWHGTIDGIELAFGARPGVRGPSLPLGYAGQVAGYGGASTFLARVADDRSASIAEGVERPFTSDRWYHIVFERSDDELRIAIDGETVFRRLDPLPPPVHAHGVFLRTFADDVAVRGLSVTRLGHPAQTTPLVAVDALAQCGQVELAVREALRIAEDLGHDELAFRALARACLLAATLPAGRNAELVASARQRLGRLPGAERWWSAVLEADATAAWLAGDWAGSLDACERALPADAGSQTAKSLLNLLRRRLPPVDAVRFLNLLMRTGDVTALDLSHLGIADLAPLAGSRIRRLSLDGNPVQDLAPLAGLPLTHLALTDTQVTQITALRGAPLLFLSLGGTAVEDLGPLRGAPLRHLIIDRSRVADPAPVSDCPLEFLQATMTPLRDLQVLGNALHTLAELHISSTQVSDITSLASARKLRNLSIDSTAVIDLAPLAGLPLESLNCSRTAVSDLSPLRGAPLAHLRCSATQITDLSPLARMPLQSLMFMQSAVQDVAPLADTPLRFLGLSGSQVSDLRPLPATLEEILAWDVPLIHPPTHPVRRLVHGWPHLEEAAWQAGLTAWIRQPSAPGALQEMRVLRAMATDDLEALRRAAVVHVGRRLLHLPLAMTRDQAASWVARLGGTLYSVPSGPVDPFVIGLLPPSPLRSHRRLWTDLRVDATGRMVDAAGVLQDQPVPVRARPGMEINITGPPYPGFSVLPPGSVECEALIDLGPSMTP